MSRGSRESRGSRGSRGVGEVFYKKSNLYRKSSPTPLLPLLHQ